MGAGRPTDYRDEYCELAERMCMLGLIDSELAEVFDVCEQTLNNWKSAHPEFMESIKRGRVISDANVAKSLYHRAIGYNHPAEKIMMFQGEVFREEFTEHYPPDTQAASLWLRNRQPRLWRDQKQLDNTSSDGTMTPGPAVVVDADAVRVALEKIKKDI